MQRNLLLFAFAFVPTLVLSSVGIMILVFQRAASDIVFGILVLILSLTTLTGAIIIQQLWRRQARKEKLQTDFVAKVSHELRTPLASIRMFVDTLKSQDTMDPNEQSMCLDVISTETSRLTSMIERLLSWGRMESGRRTYELRPESVATLIGEALAQLEPQLQGMDIHIDLRLPDDSPAVNADREAMVETLLNLLSNAVKFGGKDKAIVVRVHQDKGRVLIEVEDEGPGIPRHEQRRIFEKFYRGDSQVAEQIKGSGLGLAMARLVVGKHRGKIRLSSLPGAGACFTIDLPALPDPAAALEVPPG